MYKKKLTTHSRHDETPSMSYNILKSKYSMLMLEHISENLSS